VSTSAGTLTSSPFIVSTTQTDRESPLIAYGIQLMGDRHGLSAWRWLFIVEGIISMVLGAACWATLPKTAEHAWFLNAQERQLMEDKRRKDFVYKGESRLSWADVKLAFADPMVIMAGVCLFCASIPLFGVRIRMTLIRARHKLPGPGPFVTCSV
jgi:hypothetical protein